MTRRAPHAGWVPESGVLKACLDLLGWSKIWHMRLNTTGTRIVAVPCTPCGSRCCLPPKDEDERVLWEQRHCQRLNTAVLWIETKSDSGEQRKHQEMFQKEVEAAGHHYLLVRDVDTLRNWLKERGVI